MPSILYGSFVCRMGKRSHGKSIGRGKVQTKDSNNQNIAPRKLSRQKRNELTQLAETLLKASTNIQSIPNASKEWETHLDIQKLLEKVTQLESEMKVPLTDRSSYFEQFTAWMRDNGAEIKGVKISQFLGYDYGLRAERDLEEGDLVIAVPRKLMLTTETVKDSVLGPLLQKDAMLQHMPNVALALLLLAEKFSPNSFWKPYIAVLPQQYTTVLYFKTHELQELKGSPSLEPALKQCRNIARQYAYFNKLFQNTSEPASKLLRDVFTYEQYCWAVSTVMTRQNFVPSSDGNSMLNALIPMWDMCNHTNGKLSTDFSVALQRSECLALRPYCEGEQVFIFYGARTNSELFMHNGFVFPDNTHDALPLRLGVSRADPRQPLRIELLVRLGLPTGGDFLLRSGPQPVDGRLLAFLRIFSMGQEHLERWLASERACDLVYADCAMETEVETRTWNFLLARIDLLLAAYPTDLQTACQADMELLERGQFPSPCHRLAIQLRASEKQILQGALEYVRQRIRP